MEIKEYLQDGEVVALIPMGESVEPWTVKRANKELEALGKPIRLQSVRVIEGVWLESDESFGTDTQTAGFSMRTIVGKPQEVNL